MVINVCWAKPSVGEEPFKFEKTTTVETGQQN
jgi:hypothetical protein